MTSPTIHNINPVSDHRGRKIPANVGDVPRRLRRGGIWIFAGRLCGMVTVFVTIAVLARALSASDFAAYVVTAAIVTLLGVAGSLGLNQLICRHVAALLALHEYQQSRRLAQRIAIFGLAGAFVAATIYFLAAPALAKVLICDQLAEYRLPIAGWLFLLIYSQIVAETFRGIHHLFAAGMLAGVSGGFFANVQLLAGVILFWQAGTLAFSHVAWLAFASFVLPTIGGLFWLVLAWPRAPDDMPTEQSNAGALSLRRLTIEGLPIMLVNLVALGYDQSGQLIAKRWGTDLDVAVYEGVWRLAMIGIVPLTMLGLAASSTMAEWWVTNQTRKLERLAQGIASLSCLVTVLPLIALAVLAHPVLATIFDERFVVGVSSLWLLCGVQLLRNWMGPCDSLLIMSGHQVWAFLSFSVAIPLLMLGPWAVAEYGVFGMTAVVAAGILSSRCLQYLAVRFFLQIRPHANFSLAFLRQVLGFLFPR